MRRLIAVIVILAGLWGGYWFVGKSALEAGLAGWIEDRRAEGWVAEYAALSVRGFPNRFDTTFERLDLADPDTGVAWSLPFFQILALSYRPNHVILVWPDQHMLSSPIERWTITSAELQASVVVEPGTDLVLERSAAVARAFRVVSDAGWTSGAAETRFATRQAEGAANTHDIALEATDVRPSTPVLDLVDPEGRLPDKIARLRLETTVTFDRPWDRFAIERSRPQVTALVIDDLTALWGRLDLRAAGSLTVGDRGLADGEITVKAVNWREMLDIAVASGILPENARPSVENGLELLAGLSGRPDTIDAPLTIRRGVAFLGPVPIGTLPPLTIR